MESIRHFTCSLTVSYRSTFGNKKLYPVSESWDLAVCQPCGWFKRHYELNCWVTFEVSLFRLDEIDEKLPVHIKWLDGWKISLMPTYDYYWKILNFSCLVFLHRCIFFIFIISLLVIYNYLASFYPTPPR